jgi:hypothetical protein
VLGAILVEHPRSGFAGDEHAGAGVPWLVAEHDAGIQPAFGGPCEIDGGRPQHPDPLRVVGESFGEAQAQAVLALRILPKGVLVDRDEGIGKRRRSAYVAPLAIGVGTLS